jgi:hypothetical protein
MRLDEARLRIAYKESQELSATVARECDEAEEVFPEGDERVSALRRSKRRRSALRQEVEEARPQMERDFEQDHKRLQERLEENASPSTGLPPRPEPG